MDFNNEVWKDIDGYEGLYQVSNFGRVKSLMFINNIVRKHREKFVSLNITKKRRCLVHLYKEGKRKAVLVHRLVALAFIENPNNYPQINHKDGNPKNNTVENLEWCNASYNAKHAYNNKLNNLLEYNISNMKKIIRNDGKIFDNAYMASKELNVSVCSIRDCLKGRIKTCKGFKFDYL